MSKTRQNADKRHEPGRTQSKLQPALMEWEDIFQAIGHPSFILATDHTILSCNKAITELTGKSPEQLIGRKCYEVFHKKDMPPDACPMEKLVESGHFETVEMEMEAMDRTFLVSCTPILDRNGALDRIIHIATDITERKQIEEKLRDEEEQLSVILEKLPDGFYIHDLDGRFLRVNRAACKMTGYSEKELTSMTVADLDKESITRKDREKIWRKLERGDSFLLVNAIQRRKDGYIYPVEIRINSTVFNGQPVILALVRDITERKKAEQTLRTERDKLRALMDGINRAGIGIDIIGANYEIIFQNESLKNSFGDCTGEICFKKYMAREKPCEDCSLIPAIKQNKVTRTEKTGLNGRTYELFSAPLQNADGTCDKAIEIIADITERKRSEEKLRDNQRQLKLLASELSYAEERERRRIAMGIHDNLSQKLAMAKLNLEVLKESVSEQSIRNAIASQCDIMAEIIDDTRTLTFDLSNPVLYEIGLEWAVKNLIETDYMNRGGMKFKITTTGDKIEMDEDIKVVLFKAVRELLINTVKHAKAGNVHVNISRKAAEVVITVEDDGVGFDVNKLGLPSGVKGGFGLFNIRERLEYIGGWTEIESRPGKGTRIVLTAPVKKSESGRERVTLHESADSR